MTDLLLPLILVMLCIMVLLQVQVLKHLKQTSKQHYEAYNVQTCVKVCNRSQYHVRELCKQMYNDGWELVAAHLTKNKNEILFFTRKKIRKHYDK